MKLIPLLLILAIVAVFVSCKPTKDTTKPTTDIVDLPKEDTKDDLGQDTEDDIKEAKENNPDELIGSAWSVSYIQELDARFLPEKKASITFNEENKSSISLSVNSCVGSYKANGTTIKIVEEGCTEMCCDNDFDKQLLALIRGNEFSYTLSGNKLILNAKNAKVVLSKN